MTFTCITPLRQMERGSLIYTWLASHIHTPLSLHTTLEIIIETYSIHPKINDFLKNFKQIKDVDKRCLYPGLLSFLEWYLIVTGLAVVICMHPWLHYYTNDFARRCTFINRDGHTIQPSRLMSTINVGGLFYLPWRHFCPPLKIDLRGWVR